MEGDPLVPHSNDAKVSALLETAKAKMNKVMEAVQAVNYIGLILLYSGTVCCVMSVVLFLVVNNDGLGHDLSFLNALFVTVSAFSASGLSTVDYSGWNSASLSVLAIDMELGCIVLLTTLPSIIRYRGLKPEFDKLVSMLATPEHEATESINDEIPIANTSFYAAEAARLSMEGCGIQQRSSTKQNRLSLGERIVYEDALASVSQNMDICCIVIFGCFTYWLLAHIIFFLLALSVHPAGWSLFTVISAFNNAGLALAQSNFGDQLHNNFTIFIFWVLMPLGNTLFPVFFRFLISILHRSIRRVTRYEDGRYRNVMFCRQPLIVWQHSVRLFLRHPRAYYTHMFPKQHTLMIAIIWWIMTAIGFAMFIPDFNNPKIFEDLSLPSQLNVAMFQTVTVRTTGFVIINIETLNIGHLAWWVFAMYAAAYPFIVAERASANQDMDAANTLAEFRQEATNVVGRDLVWLYLGVIVIALAEKVNMNETASTSHYSDFLRIVFELSSAFGNVGLSLSLPKCVYSFSGSLTSSVSVIIVIATMFCGKHRGLPASVDESISIHVKQYIFEESDQTDENVSEPKSAKVIRIGPANPTSRDLVLAFEAVDREDPTSPVSSPTYRRKREVDAALAELRVRLVRFYEYYNPSRCSQIDRIIEGFWHNPTGLMENLTHTYGEEPTTREQGGGTMRSTSASARRRFELDWHDSVQEAQSE